MIRMHTSNARRQMTCGGGQILLCLDRRMTCRKKVGSARSYHDHRPRKSMQLLLCCKQA